MEIDRNDWCILRTSGRHTLGLAASLAADGYDVWTPVETKRVRIPRVNVKRDIRLPIMPSYVFARGAHLVDLLQLAAMPVKPRRGAGCMDPAHAGFSVLHAFGRIPMVADRHLTELRKIEARRTPIKRAAFSFPENASAKVNGGVFGGLIGVVVRSTPLATVLRFHGSFPVEIPTSLLEPDGVSAEQSERAPRHRNAAKYLRQTPSVGKALSEKCEACNDEIAGRGAVSAATRP